MKSTSVGTPVNGALAKGYKSCITRVVRGAGNWKLFAGDENNTMMPLPGTKIVANYTNPRINPDIFYRAIYQTDITQALNFFKTLYSSTI